MNNPLMYTDPSGYTWFSQFGGWISSNWKPIVTTVAAIGAGVATVLTMGAASPLLIATLAGGAAGFTSGVLGTALNGGNFGQCLGAGLLQGAIGAVAGLAGAGIGSGVNSLLSGGNFLSGVIGNTTSIATGFCSGFVTGAAGGFAGGFVAGFASAAISGNNFSNMLISGLNFGWKGALFGGIVGGIVGGIDASNHGRDFWTGAPKQYGIFCVTNNGSSFIDQKDYTDYSGTDTQGHYATTIQANNNITITSNGLGGEQIDINIPAANGATAEIPMNSSIISTTYRNSVLTLQTTTPIEGSQITIWGFRYESNPITRISSLFYSR